MNKQVFTGKQSERTLIIILLSAFLLGTLMSCAETESNLSAIETDNIVSVNTGTSNTTEDESESSPDPDTSETSETQLSPAERMAAGEIISSHSTNQSWDARYFPLINWFSRNMMTEYGSISSFDYMRSRSYPYFNDFTLMRAIYNITFNNNGTKDEKIAYIVFGYLESSPNNYVLINGGIVESVYFSLEEHWDKIKQHAVFGEYVDEFPSPVISESMTELDIGAIIGKDRHIYYNIPYSDTVVAVISSNKNIVKNHIVITCEPYIADFKMDFIDIAKGTLARESYFFPDFPYSGLIDFGIDVYYHMGNENLLIQFSKNSYYAKETDYILYTLTSNEDGSITASSAIYTTPQIVNKYWYSDLHPLISESGRFESFRKDYNLYLRDNLKNKDILIHKAFAIENYEEFGFISAVPAYFVGDVLYYNIIGYECTVGIGSYDPAEGKQNEYKNGLYTIGYANGYVYTETDFFDDESYFGRFNINKPEKIEKLIEGWVDDYSYIFTSDEKYIIAIKARDYFRGETELPVDDSYAYVYDALTFELLNTHTLTSPIYYLKNGMLVGDYLYLPAEESDNIAYIVKLY